MRYSENESDVLVLSRFHLGLKDDLRRELIVRDVSTIEQSFQIVDDLNQSLVYSFSRQTNYRDTPRLLMLNFNPIRPNLSLILGLVVPLQGVK